MIRAALPVALFFVAALFAAPVSLLFAQNSAFTNVNCNAPGVSLQQHIDNAPAGATLGITGPCVGPFIIRRDVLLVGGVIHSLSAPNGSNFVLLIKEGASVRMHDLRFNAQGVSTGIQVLEGSTLVAGANVLIENALDWGIGVGQNSTLTLGESSLRYNGNGLQLADSSHATISGSSISDNVSFGISVEASSTANIQNSQILNNGHTGLFIEASSVATLVGTTISGNGFIGVRVEFANTGLHIGGAPSTIENNSPIDVSCIPGSFIAVSQPVISGTKLSDIEAGCMVRPDPASIFVP